MVYPIERERSAPAIVDIMRGNKPSGKAEAEYYYPSEVIDSECYAAQLSKIQPKILTFEGLKFSIF